MLLADKKMFASECCPVNYSFLMCKFRQKENELCEGKSLKGEKSRDQKCGMGWRLVNNTIRKRVGTSKGKKAEQLINHGVFEWINQQKLYYY